MATQVKINDLISQLQKAYTQAQTLETVIDTAVVSIANCSTLNDIYTDTQVDQFGSDLDDAMAALVKVLKDMSEGIKEDYEAEESEE